MCRGKIAGQTAPSKGSYLARQSSASTCVRPLQLVYAALARPMKPVSWGGARYLFVLTDGYSRKSLVILLALGQWAAQVERECGQSLGRLQINNGGKFIKQTLKDWLATRGVKQNFTPPRSPQSNSVYPFRKMHNRRWLSPGFGGGSWGEVFLAASYLRNYGPVSNRTAILQEL